MNAPKEQKSTTQLATLIMEEVRKNSDWNNVTDVAITRPVQHSRDHPNWGVGFAMNGPGVAPTKAFDLVTRLQGKYDCVWP